MESIEVKPRYKIYWDQGMKSIEVKEWNQLRSNLEEEMDKSDLWIKTITVNVFINLW